jgi:putative phosphoesterase
MNIALLGDVHANLPALEAVLADASRRAAEAIWNLGDFVGYGPFPDEVVTRFQALGATSIVGNYDLKVLKFPEKKNKWRKSKLPQKWLAFQWAYEHLSEGNRAYLRALPKEVRLEIAGWSILLTHGSPASNEEALTPDTPQERLRALLPRAKAQVIVCGHSHRAFTRRVDGAWFINTGSVGRPDDGDPRAAYAILQIEAEGLQVEHFRLAYDIERTAAALRAYGLPEAFARMLFQGRDLETVLGEA